VRSGSRLVCSNSGGKTLLKMSEQTKSACRMYSIQKDVGITFRRKGDPVVYEEGQPLHALKLAIDQCPHQYWTSSLSKREILWVPDCFVGTPGPISLNYYYSKRCKVSRISEAEIGNRLPL
jgi:hypothetical protein